MHITNQKFSFDIFTVGNWLNIFKEHTLLNILMICGIKWKIYHYDPCYVLLTLAKIFLCCCFCSDWFCGPGSRLSCYEHPPPLEDSSSSFSPWFQENKTTSPMMPFTWPVSRHVTGWVKIHSQRERSVLCLNHDCCVRPQLVLLSLKVQYQALKSHLPCWLWQARAQRESRPDCGSSGG